ALALPQVQPGVAPQGSSSAAPGASAAAVPGVPAALPAPHARAARRPEHHAAQRAHPRAHGAASAVCSRAGWYVQVGAFAELKSYEQLRARLERFHLPNCRGAHSPHGLHVLLVGPYATRAEAQRLRSHLKEPLRKASYLRHLGAK
ncbi:MAG: SPOR domain-containing protein, partial [Betaproteobacteria bacterium]|nr:SPOR domain-containing protein [Betaproteobacteria bacterium]